MTKKEIEKEVEEIQAIIHESKKGVCVFMLTVLQSIINEQVAAKQLKRDVGNYLYKAVKDQCMRKGFID